MKSFVFWRYFLFAAMWLMAALLLASVWRAFAAPSWQTEAVTATAMTVTPTVTLMPGPPQSANTDGIILFALILLVVILSGMALGWWLTATASKAAAGKTAGISRKKRGIDARGAGRTR